MMKKLLAIFMCALCLVGCSAKPVAIEPSSTPSPAATSEISATPSPSPTQTDIDQTDEADYYFDFGQDDMIRLNYDVSYPKSAMTGWTETGSTRVCALLTLINQRDTLTVLMEDAPEYSEMAAYMEYARQMLAFTYADIALSPDETVGDYIRITADLPGSDGGKLICYYGTQDGLYVTCELVAYGDAAQTSIDLFESTFMKEISFTYTEIDSLDGSPEEE